uniref:Uncharacterized protein n=1 Tax=Arundo donax TaxID=35708 RepID=A0A0A9BJI1_ARUDO
MENTGRHLTKHLSKKWQMIKFTNAVFPSCPDSTPSLRV